MTQKDRKDLNLEDAIRAVREDAVEPAVLSTSAARVWQRLHTGLSGSPVPAVEKIRGCADVLALLPAYRQGSLATARALLVEEHLRDCLGCRARAQGSGAQDVAGWRQVRRVPEAPAWSWAQLGVAAAVFVLLGLASFLVHYEFFAVPPGSRATVQSVEGQLYRVSTGGDRLLAAGEELQEGERIRAGVGAHAFVRLTDGSMVEMNERAELSVSARRRSKTIKLERGNIIVEAARQRSGNLYVHTRDARVAVTGTIFSVNGGVRGSRVAVIEGVVKVAYNGLETTLTAGDQVASDPSLEPVALSDEIAWSRKLDEYLGLLAEFAALQKKLETVPMPGLRYESRILPLLPSDAFVYVAIPNLGDAIHQAHQLLQQQMQQSERLRQWWQQAQGNGDRPSPDQLLARVYDVSRYLGEEIVLAMAPAGDDKDILILAQAARSGLAEYLAAEMAKDEAGSELRLYDAASLASAPAERGKVLVLVRPDMIALSSSAARLRQINAQLDAGQAGGFAASAFGQRMLASYAGGASLLVGIDLAPIHRAAEHTSEQAQRAGFTDMRFVVIERKEAFARSENQVAFEFSRNRRGIPSWMGAPGPIGALEFVSSRASLVSAMVSKSPALMLDDVLGMQQRASDGLAEMEARLGLRLREDIAASLGNDFAFAFDGPFLPTPSWKLILEVNDPQRLQYSLEQIVQHANLETAQQGKPGVTLRQESVDGRIYYSLSRGGSAFEAHYTFAEGYAVVAPTRAMVRRALQVRAGGETLLRSAEFRSLLPSGQQADVSGLVYQNLAASLEPLAGQLTAEQLGALQAVASSSGPSLLCAYGEPERIRLVSRSGSLGSDLNKLAALGLVQSIMGGTYGGRTP
jgi:hypothetical protein